MNGEQRTLLFAAAGSKVHEKDICRKGDVCFLSILIFGPAHAKHLNVCTSTSNRFCGDLMKCLSNQNHPYNGWFTLRLKAFVAGQP
ncbi:hypothetical protein [Paenibacillus lautus]|uniref:hypothetical protein n=1 Tax=Paenibacillus lautus TaxID=1401 RepID=UPI001C7DF2E2|nr:hypothetical protein [Paenibacillus lautus]MBX4147801.1 hypothetical protein [Paenibacillus lautus]